MGLKGRTAHLAEGQGYSLCGRQASKTKHWALVSIGDPTKTLCLPHSLVAEENPGSLPLTCLSVEAGKRMQAGVHRMKRQVHQGLGELFPNGLLESSRRH